MSGELACSVIVPVHEDADGALRCLEALRRQDFPAADFEIILCDNASATDPLRLQALGTSDEGGGPAVHLLSTPDPGSYRARNGGLQVARGRVLAFTDADCLPSPGWLSAGLRHLESTGLDLCAGRVAVTTRHRPSPVEVWERRNAFPQRKYVSEMNFGVTANLFVRRSVVDRVGPFSETLMSGGDRQFCQRAVGAGASIGYCEDAWVSHPARITAREVALKTRRVLQGARDMGELGFGTTRWLRSGRPPLGALRRSRELASARERALYVVGEVQAHYIRWWLTREVSRG